MTWKKSEISKIKLNQQTVLVASLTATRARKHDINTLNLNERIKKKQRRAFFNKTLRILYKKECSNK